MNFYKRLFLSLYFYEKKYEHKRFFDAWWQFTTTITYILVLLAMAIVNSVCGIFHISFETKYYFIVAIPIMLLDFIISKPLKEKYEHRLLDSITGLTPIPRWQINMLAAFGLIVLIISFTLIPKK